MQTLLRSILKNPQIHARWLNTLSLMENTGARKIKKCEHPVFVSEIILKHSAEEARHAYYLKKQIQKIDKNSCPTYERQYLLASDSSANYLQKLDIEACRYIKSKFGLKNDKLKYAAYLLVTYAIEVRADELYPQYQQVLSEENCPVSVRNIIVEETNHLAEMIAQLKAFSNDWESMCKHVCEIETDLFQTWIKNVEIEVGVAAN